MPRCYMVKKWAAKYQAEMDETWTNEENAREAGADVDVEVTSAKSSNIYVESAGTPVTMTVQFYDNDQNPIDEVYIGNTTPVAITDHQYYQAVDDSVSNNEDGKCNKNLLFKIFPKLLFSDISERNNDYSDTLDFRRR